MDDRAFGVLERTSSGAARSGEAEPGPPVRCVPSRGGTRKRGEEMVTKVVSLGVVWSHMIKGVSRHELSR